VLARVVPIVRLVVLARVVPIVMVVLARVVPIVRLVVLARVSLAVAAKPMPEEPSVPMDASGSLLVS